MPNNEFVIFVFYACSIHSKPPPYESTKWDWQKLHMFNEVSFAHPCLYFTKEFSVQLFI